VLSIEICFYLQIGCKKQKKEYKTHKKELFFVQKTLEENNLNFP